MTRQLKCVVLWESLQQWLQLPADVCLPVHQRMQACAQEHLRMRDACLACCAQQSMQSMGMQHSLRKLMSSPSCVSLPCLKTDTPVSGPTPVGEPCMDGCHTGNASRCCWRGRIHQAVHISL